MILSRIMYLLFAVPFGNYYNANYKGIFFFLFIISAGDNSTSIKAEILQHPWVMVAFKARLVRCFRYNDTRDGDA